MDITKYKHLGDIIPRLDESIRRLLGNECNYTTIKVDLIAVKKDTQELVANTIHVGVMSEEVATMVEKVIKFCDTKEKRLALEFFLQEKIDDSGSDVV